MTDIDRSDELLEMYAEETGDPLAGMFSGAWLDTQVFPPLEYAVPGIIPEGFGLLVSPPKAGKSWLVCGIGLACALGGLALGAIHVPKRPVLYLALEDGHRRLQSRSRRIMHDERLPAGIHFVTKAKPAEVIPMIAEFLKRYSDDKPLIILDTLGKARSARPPGADLYAWDYDMGTRLKDTIDSVPGASLLVVHHTRKAESSDFVDSVSGSQGIAGSADFVLVLSRKRHSDEALLSVTGRDVAESEYALTTDDGIWQLDGTTLSEATKAAEQRRETARLGDRSLEALAFVNSRSTETRPTDVANALGVNSKRAGEVLSRLAESGAIRKASRGVYLPTGTAESAESAENAGQNVIPFPHLEGTAETVSAPAESTAENETDAEQPIPQLPQFPHQPADNQPAVTHCPCGVQLLSPASRASGVCRGCASKQETGADEA
jgi:AAA domain